MGLRRRDIATAVAEDFQRCQTSRGKLATFNELKLNKRYYPHIYTDQHLRQFIYPLLMVLFKRLFADCLADTHFFTQQNINNRIDDSNRQLALNGPIANAIRKDRHYYTKTKRFYQQAKQLLNYAQSEDSDRNDCYRIAEGLNHLKSISLKPEGTSFWRVQRREHINTHRPYLTKSRNMGLSALAGLGAALAVMTISSLLVVTLLGAPTIIGGLVWLGILIGITIASVAIPTKLSNKTKAAFDNINEGDPLNTKPNGLFFSRCKADKISEQQQVQDQDDLQQPLLQQ